MKIVSSEGILFRLGWFRMTILKHPIETVNREIKQYASRKEIKKALLLQTLPIGSLNIHLRAVGTRVTCLHRATVFPRLPDGGLQLGCSTFDKVGADIIRRWAGVL